MKRSFFSRVVGETLLLAVLTLVAMGLSWLVRTPRFPLVAEISDYEMDLDYPVFAAHDCVAFYEAGTHLFIDTRNLASPAPYIPGAFSISLDSFDEDLRQVFDFIYPEDALLLYGDGRLQATAAVAARFEERGYKVEGIMRGGIEAWHKAGGELSGEVSP
ncbi:rhodanese-like domain-containing protein [bacterium]|nr:rhodanese-like domain-containing protein [bacterium]